MIFMFDIHSSRIRKHCTCLFCINIYIIIVVIYICIRKYEIIL